MKNIDIYIINRVNRVVKDVQIFIYVKKRLVWVVFKIKDIRDNDNETGLKEGSVIEMSTTVLPLRDARSLRFCILLTINFNTNICNRTTMFKTQGWSI